MGKINVLDSNLINKIAAGEVVERPASVIKELIENAVDALSSRIDVFIEDGGTSLIEVRDNGLGMTPDDIRMAFVRHATSKLRNEADLMSIATLGFRGEALPSIASVGKVQILSRTKEAIIGSKVVIHGGEEIEQEVCGCPVGTNVIVQNLFYNIPARKKFLGSERSESMKVFSVFKQQALAHPDVAFRFYKDGRMITTTSGNNRLLDAIIEFLGTEFAKNSVQVDYEWAELRVYGQISTDKFTRNNRRDQYFFINGRPIVNRTIQHALEDVYRGRIPTRRYPVACLHIHIPPGSVDVNVHPAKSEVRFAQSIQIHSLITRAIKDALTKMEHETAVEVVESRRPMEDNNGLKGAKSPLSLDIAEEPRQHSDFASYAEVREYQSSLSFNPSTVTSGRSRISSSDRSMLSQIMVLGQIHNSYIALQTRRGFAIIDQHAAHERIIYERLKRRELDEDIQSLVVPIVLSLSKTQAGVLRARLREIRELGIQVDIFGNNSFAIRGLPNFLARNLSKEDVNDIFNDVMCGSGEQTKTYLEDKLLISLSCKGAVKARQALNRHDMIELVTSLASCDRWMTCPHGRPTIWIIQLDDLHKKFLRS